MGSILGDPIKKRQLLSSYGIFILNGMLALSIGSIMPLLRDARSLSYTLCGILVSVHSIGNLISGFLAGILPGFIGRRRSIMLFSLCYPISFILVLLGKGHIAMIIAFFMTGLARGGGSNFCNTTINDIAPGKASVLNGLHAMFSIGAFIYPFILMIITMGGDSNWIYGVLLLVVMGIISCIIYGLIPLDWDKPVKNETTDKSDATESKFGFFKEPRFIICTLTMFFYLCAEQGVVGWLVTYFKDTGLLSGNIAQSTASIQWGMVLLGRLTAAYLTSKIDKAKLLPIMGLGMLGFFALLVKAANPGLIIAGIMGFGFFMAAIYPTTVAFSGDIIKRYRLAWSFMLTGASFGSILMPSIIGHIAESRGLSYGMGSVLIVITIELICIITLICINRVNHSELA